MLRTLIIVLILCGGLAWFLTSKAPQGGGTLTLKPAATFPEDKKADLGRTVARFLPYCPGFGQLGGEVLFTDFARTGTESARITFTVPQDARIPANFGVFNSPCVYDVEGSELRIEGPSCQALCIGKPLDTPIPVMKVDLNPKPQSPAK